MVFSGNARITPSKKRYNLIDGFERSRNPLGFTSVLFYWVCWFGGRKYAWCLTYYLRAHPDITRAYQALLHEAREVFTAFVNSSVNWESKNSSTCLTLSSPSPFGAISTIRVASLTKGTPTVVSA